MSCESTQWKLSDLREQQSRENLSSITWLTYQSPTSIPDTNRSLGLSGMRYLVIKQVFRTRTRELDAINACFVAIFSMWFGKESRQIYLGVGTSALKTRATVTLHTAELRFIPEVGRRCERVKSLSPESIPCIERFYTVLLQAPRHLAFESAIVGAHVPVQGKSRV